MYMNGAKMYVKILYISIFICFYIQYLYLYILLILNYFVYPVHQVYTYLSRKRVSKQCYEGKTTLFCLRLCQIVTPTSKLLYTYGGSVLQRGSVQQSRVGLTLKSEIGREVTPPASKPPYTQTAARVAAVLAKSAAATQPPSHHQRPQFFGHNPNLKCMFYF